MSETTAVGRVSGLRSYPVKSLDAPNLDQVQVLAGGLEHDRGWAVVGADGDVVTGRQVPSLSEVRAMAPSGPSPAPTLLLPGADRHLADEEAVLALSEVVGRSVTLQPASGAGPGFNEVAAVHLVSRQAVERAAADEGTILGDPACSVEQPRANVVVELDGEELETSWVGREVSLGEVVLRISKQPKHCLGVYADVVRPGLLRVGDGVRLG
ncbi:MOSC N-terminal beta barrel domain-containing protein [Angustibacter sp. McL0619]|uniref:MOSC N-terminal beta barrel domain-containing protein n=1 Tax=Angustibacter sp. McL0619 TaxID=3415676 RepID=UPI003CE97EE2